MADLNMVGTCWPVHKCVGTNPVGEVHGLEMLGASLWVVSWADAQSSNAETGKTAVPGRSILNINSFHDRFRPSEVTCRS